MERHRFPDKAVVIAPSLLAGDFARMGEEARRAEAAGADILHLDVMDGHFVEPITFGAQAVAALRRYTRLFLDAHLMVDNPERQIPQFLEAGVDNLTIHVEASKNIEGDLEQIKGAGARCGLTLNPDTPVEQMFPYIERIDMLLVMSVFPGYGGQQFIPESVDRIRALREKADGLGTPLDIEVDGGIDPETARLVVQAGANVLVAGTAVFRARNMAEAIKELRVHG
ncbi:MAG: ribulose-phosphate 3-epimerase [Verrucomicrobia bacterium]|nr:ribulose-phosphate 3-epimerase [Verrucomicrobiota bacterium]